MAAARGRPFDLLVSSDLGRASQGFDRIFYDKKEVGAYLVGFSYLERFNRYKKVAHGVWGQHHV